MGSARISEDPFLKRIFLSEQSRDHLLRKKVSSWGHRFLRYMDRVCGDSCAVVRCLDVW